MMSSFILRKVNSSDCKVLLDWRNDDTTRKNSFNDELISIDTHKKYIEDTLTNPNRNLFIMEYNNVPVGTIREDKLGKNEFQLSYTIGPKYRDKKIGQTMISKYLIRRNGSFWCEVQESNVPSIKMIEKLGFKCLKTENRDLLSIEKKISIILSFDLYALYFQIL